MPLTKPLELPQGIRRVERRDVATLSHVLARAFREDPTHRWFLPSERAWRRSSHRTFAFAMGDALHQGTVLTNDGMDGVAIWNAPNPPRLGTLGQLRLACRALPPFGRYVVRAVRGFQAIEASHPRQPYWYLGVLGTEPARQGSGVGRALIEPVLARCDADGVAAWLEASREENIPYYRRFGFETTREIQLPDGPPVYGMLRTPRGAPSAPELESPPGAS